MYFLFQNSPHYKQEIANGTLENYATTFTKSYIAGNKDNLHDFCLKHLVFLLLLIKSKLYSYNSLN